jgi:hypothetical protein
MGKLKLYDTSLSRADILMEREERYLSSSVKEKFYQLLRLINLSVKMNGGKPLKLPQGKGLVISKGSL